MTRAMRRSRGEHTELEEESGNRNRYKNRKFMNMLLSSELEEHVRDLFEAASKKGTARAEQTNIINQYVQKDAHGRQIACPDAAYFKEMVEQSQAKCFNLHSGGVIKEVAISKCGNSETALQAAVSRGAIQTSVRNGIESFFTFRR